MDNTVRQVSPKDRIPFQCRHCGACCRGLEDQLMLEPLDAYRLGQHLRRGGERVDIEDVYAKYAHAAILTEGCPIFLVNTAGAENACVLLRGNRCTVYAARPRACRMYPFYATPGQPGEQFQYYQCMDAHAEHLPVQLSVSAIGCSRISHWKIVPFLKKRRTIFPGLACSCTGPDRSGKRNGCS